MISVTWEVKTQVSRLGITDMNEWAGKSAGCLLHKDRPIDLS